METGGGDAGAGGSGLAPPPAGCSLNYVVTAHKPTAVTHSIVGHFTSADDVNLILSCVGFVFSSTTTTSSPCAHRRAAAVG